MYLDMDLYIYSLYKPYLLDNRYLGHILVDIPYMDLLGIQVGMCKLRCYIEHLGHKVLDYMGQ